MERDKGLPTTLIADLLSGIRGVLADDLVGLYLYGSAVAGGFDPSLSDIDLLAVTASEVEALDLAALEAMHLGLVSRHPEWGDRLELVYIGRTTLGSFRTSSGSLAVISHGEPLHVRTDRVADWLQNWYLVRETGLSLYGADPAAVIPTIAWTEFVAATVRYADEVRNRSRAGAGAGTLAYTILTMCRVLRTVRTQMHGSKQESATWAREWLPEWGWLIDAAVECRRSRGTVGFNDERSREAAETFIKLLANEISVPAVV